MRLIKLIIGDIRFQFKYGFYFTYAIFCVFYIFLLLIFSEVWKEKAVSLMIYSDPTALGLFFMGAIILLEKSQRVLNVLAVSPISISEYILAKVVSLMFVSSVVSLILAFVAGLENIGIVVFSTALTSIIFTLLGLIVGARIHSLNQYIVVTTPIEIICFIPPVIFLFVPMTILRWFPLNSSIALIAGMSQNILLDCIVLLFIVVVLWIITYYQIKKMWINIGGVKL